MKESLKQIFVRSIGLTLATAFGGTAIGAVAGDWVLGTIIGIGSSFAVVLTTVGVAVAWKGTLELTDIQNAYRAAVAKSDSDAIKDALAVAEDGNFDYDDLRDSDPEIRQIMSEDTSNLPAIRVTLQMLYEKQLENERLLILLNVKLASLDDIPMRISKIEIAQAKSEWVEKLAYIGVTAGLAGFITALFGALGT